MNPLRMICARLKTFKGRNNIKATGNSHFVTDHFMQWNAQGDSAPVSVVSWHDAQAFIAWLNQVDGGGYRLPSEAEWEYACRAGGQHRYCGSDNLDSVAWYMDNSGDRVRPVATKAPNAWGLHDMSGNVQEWVQDEWYDNYNGTPTDGSARESGVIAPALESLNSGMDHP